jgi:hypothetical protein
MSCLRTPLNIALSLSPIALLQDKMIWTGSVGSKFVLDVGCDRCSFYAAYLYLFVDITGFFWQQTPSGAWRRI